MDMPKWIAKCNDWLMEYIEKRQLNVQMKWYRRADCQVSQENKMFSGLNTDCKEVKNVEGWEKAMYLMNSWLIWTKHTE